LEQFVSDSFGRWKIEEDTALKWNAGLAALQAKGYLRNIFAVDFLSNALYFHRTYIKPRITRFWG